MPRPPLRFLWSTTAWLLLISALAAALFVFHDTSRPELAVAADVNVQSITLEDLEAAIRERLWRSDQSWENLSPDSQKQTRLQVLESMVNNRLVRTCRLSDQEAATPLSTSAKREADMHQRQFVEPADLSRRLAAQHLTSKAFDAKVEQVLRDEAWIARQIQPRLESITRPELSTWYDQHKETLRIPQAFHAAHIFLTRHDSAKPDRSTEISRIHRQLLAREKTFAQLAAQASEDDRSKVLGGDLGWFTHQRMPPEFMAAVANLRPGQLSAPVQTPLGWHIILLLDRRESRLPAFDEVQAEIAAHLTSARREEAVNSLIASLRQRARPSVFYHAEVIDRAKPSP
ncbi:peptidylprolyl isomerase [Prosthecobacter sp.]|uniref:peptidylprolyl isomerase n=1 Tax=Prosthecobacter sp. TaxID=1965333 RepID=UPI0037835D54